MFKKVLIFITIITGSFVFPQVGIGTNSPNSSSILEAKSTNQGVLIPRIQLSSTSTYTLTGATTVAQQYNANSMLVYNTAVINDVTEGYYYWKQINSSTPGKWVKLMNGQDNVVSATNGLNINTNQNVVLGGALNTPTTITASTANTLAVAGLETGNPITDKVVVTSTNGVLKNVSSVLPKVFYMPSIVIDVSTLGTGKTIDLYAQYLSQYGTPKAVSAGAPAAIPTYSKDQLYYYVTYFDPAVFNNISVDANGIMTYSVIGNATTASFINIIFVVK